MIRFLAIISFFLLAIAQVSHAAPEKNRSADSKRKAKKIQSEAGLNIPSWGVAVDAVYDSRLDNLIPGYKILNVVLTNRGAAAIHLDPNKDQWEIRDNLGKAHGAINHLRQESDKLWSKLPQGLKEKLEYPSMVRIGNSAQIDLFFPEDVELLNFREISWKSAHFKREFNLYTASSEKNLNAGPAEKTGIPETPTYRQSIQKYEGNLPPVKKVEPEDRGLSPDPQDEDWSIKMD